MKKTVDILEQYGALCATIKKGILLTSAYNGKVNPMTIAWGVLGIEWSRPIFIAFVRENRYTRQLLDASGEFTVNIPVGEYDPKILSFCGTKSGRDVDKVKELDLTLEEPVSGSVPGIAEFPLTLECKVIYRQKQVLEDIPDDILARYYPQNVVGTEPGSNRDAHIAYYGEIINAYIIEK